MVALELHAVNVDFDDDFGSHVTFHPRPHELQDREQVRWAPIALPDSVQGIADVLLIPRRHVPRTNIPAIDGYAVLDEFCVWSASARGLDRVGCVVDDRRRVRYMLTIAQTWIHALCPRRDDVERGSGRDKIAEEIGSLFRSCQNLDFSSMVMVMRVLLRPGPARQYRLVDRKGDKLFALGPALGIWKSMRPRK